jgi:hypothetical protein
MEPAETAEPENPDLDLGDLDNPEAATEPEDAGSAPQEGEDSGLGDLNGFAGSQQDDFVGLDDFSFDGLDETLEKASVPAAAAVGAAAGQGKADKGKKPAAPEPPDAPASLDDIKISHEEFESLQKTLAGYPLNLRIACQQIMVEKSASPEKMYSLIRHLVDRDPPRVTAALAGDILGKTIFIPAGFQKSSGEALAAEQATFAYVFKNSFLPAFRLVAVIAVMVFSVGYLA